MTTEMVAKLPKWAQAHIQTLSRERDLAIRALNKWVDEQTESSVFIDELESLGEQRTETRNSPSFKRRYIQTRRMRFECEGVGLDVYLQDDGISLQWAAHDRGLTNIAMIPESYQKVRLVAKEKMR